MSKTKMFGRLPSTQNLTAFLKGTSFPASKAQLIQQASLNDADDDTLEVLRGMPEREYRDMTDVSDLVAPST